MRKIKCLLVSVFTLFFIPTQNVFAGNYDFVTANASLQYASLLPAGNNLFFQMQKTDKTTALYVLNNKQITELKVVSASNFSMASLIRNNSFSAGQKAGMLIQDYTNNRYTFWVSDGTIAGTDSVFSFSNYQTHIYPGVSIGTDYYFTVCTDVSNTTDLYKTDFTKAGTIKLKSYAKTRLFWPYADNGKLYLHGYQGTPTAQYDVLYEYATDTNRLLTGYAFGLARVYQNNLYYGTAALQKKDLTTKLVSVVGQAFDLTQLLGYFNGKIFVVGTKSSQSGLNVGKEIYSFDPSNNNFSLLKDLDSNVLGNGIPTSYFNYIFGSNYFYFIGKNSKNHSSLFVSDGSTNGTHVLQDLQQAGTPFLNSSSIMHVCGDQLYLNVPNISIGDSAYDYNTFSTCSPVDTKLSLIKYNASGFTGALQTNMVENYMDKIIFTGNDGGIGTNNKFFAIENCASYKPTGLKASNLVTTISVYPNPTTGKLWIELGSMSDKRVSIIKVLNLSGMEVFDKCVNEQRCEIDLSELPKGIYIIQIQSASEYLFKKILID